MACAKIDLQPYKRHSGLKNSHHHHNHRHHHHHDNDHHPHLCGAPCLPDGPCRQGWKLGASIAVVSQARVVVLSLVKCENDVICYREALLTPLCDIPTPRSSSGETTSIEHWGGARSSPRVVLVNVKPIMTLMMIVLIIISLRLMTLMINININEDQDDAVYDDNDDQHQ